MSAPATADQSRPLQSTEPAVDLDHLCGFTGGDLQLEGELAALYLSSAGVYLERMAGALRTGGDWRQTAHALKGASANLGARRVAALALQAERSPPSPAQLEALGQALKEVRAYFAARQPERGSAARLPDRRASDP